MLLLLLLNVGLCNASTIFILSERKESYILCVNFSSCLLLFCTAYYITTLNLYNKYHTQWEQQTIQDLDKLDNFFIVFDDYGFVNHIPMVALSSSQKVTIKTDVIRWEMMGYLFLSLFVHCLLHRGKLCTAEWIAIEQIWWPHTVYVYGMCAWGGIVSWSLHGPTNSERACCLLAS